MDTEEKEFYDKVGEINGWDFSRVKCEVEGITWDFYSRASELAGKESVLLDIGTGGGENLLKYADCFSFVVGIDLSESMVKAARAKLRRTNHGNIRFMPMGAEDLQFPSGFFDVVTSRHCLFDANEAARVLRPGGVFLTQQVGEADKENLKRMFGRGQAYREREGALKEQYIEELEAAGFTNIQSDEYNAVEYYRTPEDLLFLLQHAPIIPEFGKLPHDFKIFNKFVEENHTGKGIQTNSKRFLITAHM